MDFTITTPDIPKTELFKKLLVNCKTTEMLLNKYGPFNVTMEKKPEKAPHPFGQLAYKILVKFPWHSSLFCRIKLEITFDEIIIAPLENKVILSKYALDPTKHILTYSLNEIFAEKVSSLLQSKLKLETRGWQRPRSRDFYDLWQIYNSSMKNFNINILPQLITEKCLHKNIFFNSPKDFLSEIVVEDARKHWENNLQYFVNELPAFDKVKNELAVILNKIFDSN